MAVIHVVTRYRPLDSAGGILLKFFFLGAFTGTLLLALPISRTGDFHLLDLFFTAASAITVTGLVTLDTGSDFSFFGQLVIALLIQVGGLGYMLIGSLTLLGKQHLLSLRQQATLGVTGFTDSGLNLFSILRFALILTALMVVFTALALSVFWVPAYGWQDGLWRSVFHANSAYNNAGFALFSDSLVTAAGGQPVAWIHAFAFITGGLGFIVTLEVLSKDRKWSIHTRIMVYGSIAMLALGTLLIMLFERHNGSLGQGMERFTQAFFQAATTRTAGFNSMNLDSLSDASLTFMMVNMVIGAGPGSTAGGIRLTTFVLLLSGLVAALQGRHTTRLLGRSLDVNHLLRASGILVLTLALLTVISLALLTLEPEQPGLVVIFEAVSALGTVGLSLGATGELSEAGKVLVILVMLIGKVSPVLLFSALAGRPDRPIRHAGGYVALG
ncbi:TrkH family potassium uptake protein [Natronospirillum operosum]|uniref:TrkH family potassium uptake protein n=1 Tax=Natronospirillum operosum TaxID=2759953 RepID=A0A4Z0WD97_9GAMM|nr:potassium transporter TrkG [Natronospirillum operosum]TGG94083.1 TrkH family potassium uptake protein [Natronospirillum operosum]